MGEKGATTSALFNEGGDPTLTPATKNLVDPGLTTSLVDPGLSTGLVELPPLTKGFDEPPTKDFDTP